MTFWSRTSQLTQRNGDIIVAAAGRPVSIDDVTARLLEDWIIAAFMKIVIGHEQSLLDDSETRFR